MMGGGGGVMLAQSKHNGMAVDEPSDYIQTSVVVKWRLYKTSVLYIILHALKKKKHFELLFSVLQINVHF